MGKPIEIEAATVRAFIAEEAERRGEQSDVVFPDSPGVQEASQRHLDLATSRSVYSETQGISPELRRTLRRIHDIPLSEEFPDEID